ncbi:ROK family protein [Arabiibacter massiliensis]|uniref:ROK family protein n=1 Tax=Arabiibacter massiliensis TaxID=1870985 RepID=UPI0018D6AF60|nr:ROK family protein [Arabiibacter massiliensis]
MRERIYQIVQRARPGDKVSHAYDAFIVAVAFVSIVPLMFRPQDSNPQLDAVLNMVDVVTVYILFFDYLLRWMTHDLKTGKKGWREFAKYPFTPLAIVDLLAILPSLGVLPESFKFLRVLRVTKIFRYSKSLTIVGNVFRAEKSTLLSVLGVAVMYIFVSGLIMFVNEPDTFDNFFDSLYWATTALTTVGYGDVYPVTDVGKFISMVSSLFGIAIIALPAGIITGGFLEQVRRCQADSEAYFRPVEHAPYQGRTPFSYGGVRAYVRAHPKMAAYGATMLACVLVNQGLYAAASALGAPVWLDTTGTALAAILLEPAAGLIVGFANNLVLAVQMGNAGNLLYYGLSAVSALVFGLLFGRGRKVTARSLGLAALLLVAVESALSCALAFALADGQLTTAAERLYGGVLAAWGAPGPLAVFGALLVDKLIDTAAVFVLVIAASRGIIGSRLDPARWFGARGQAAEAEPASEPAPAPPEPAPSRAAAPGDDTAAGPRYVVGIDVGGTHTKVGAFTLDGALAGTHVFDSQNVLADGSHGYLAREIGAVLDKASIEADRVAAVGLAVPGAVAAEESLKLCPHIDLDLRSYKAFLRSAFPKAVVAVMNDADAAALGDQWRGVTGERGDENAVFVTLGTGVGAGLVAKGRPVAGMHGAAGEIGHLCVDPDEDEPCACGRAGCLEQYASATGLVHQARRAFAARVEAADQGPETARRQAVEAFPDAHAVFEAAARRDPDARAALDRFSDALGFGLAQVACVVDPDVFVLGGGLSERADDYLGSVRARYRACAVPPCRDTPIVASTLGNECGIYGAAYRALEVLADGEGYDGNRSVTAAREEASL